ncbi:MAG TPA: phosphodiester glycosidase family protein [Puia sp.]|nr:phosphodiester glycosidase family protein [Puia sp.]
MRKFIRAGLLGLLTLIYSLNTTAQKNAIGQKPATDSVAIATAKWELIKVSSGIKLKHCSFDSTLFNSNQNINIVEVKLNGKNHIHIGEEPQKLKGTSEFASEAHAIAAINGTFFDMKQGGSEDYIRSDGKVINRTRVKAGGVRSFHQRAAVVIDHNKVRIMQWDSTADWEDHLVGEDIMVSGPLLIHNGQTIAWDTAGGFFRRNPRSVLAMRKNRLYLIAVDGRNPKAAGMSIAELTQFLKWMKFSEAINLDGGGSTTLWVKNYPYGGVVNHPSDNRKWVHTDSYKAGMDLDNLPADTQTWDHAGERPVANAILITRGH